LTVGEQPADAARRELLEEAGVTQASQPIAVAMLFDAMVGTWDIVHRVDVAAHALHDPCSWEHEAVAVETHPAARTPRSHATEMLLPLVAGA
jgi:8-oxo-dGTP pyrophosphatase MutT (NUDIX family)